MPSSSAHQQRSSPVLPIAHQEATTPPEVHQQEEEEATTPPEVHQQEEDQASTTTSASTSSSSSEEEEATTQQQQGTPIMNRVIILRHRLLPPPQQEQHEARSPPPIAQSAASRLRDMILQRRRVYQQDLLKLEARRLLQKHLMEIKKEPLEGFRIKLDGENILNWTAIMFGPPGTPYQGGYFKASLDFNHYPFWPPIIRFTPPIYHPNIQRSGMLCYKILRPPQLGSTGCMESRWNVRGLLLSFLALLTEPNPDDPAHVEAALKYRRYKDHGEPAYLDAIKANVAESRKLAKRDNVIVPETIEDYMRSGIQTDEEEPDAKTAKEQDDGAH